MSHEVVAKRWLVIASVGLLIAGPVLAPAVLADSVESDGDLTRLATMIRSPAQSTVNASANEAAKALLRHAYANLSQDGTGDDLEDPVDPLFEPQTSASSCHCSAGKECGKCDANVQCDGYFEAASCSCTSGADTCQTCDWCGCWWCAHANPIGACSGACVSTVGGKYFDTIPQAQQASYPRDVNDENVNRFMELLEADIGAVAPENVTGELQLLHRVVTGLAIRDVALGITAGDGAPEAVAWAQALHDLLAYAAGYGYYASGENLTIPAER